MSEDLFIILVFYNTLSWRGDEELFSMNCDIS
jgi:hypothetical protein